VSESTKILETIWNVFYWTAFGLGWSVLPFLSVFVQTGEFTFRGRVAKAIYVNLRYYTVVGLLFGVFLVYLWFQNAFAK